MKLYIDGSLKWKAARQTPIGVNSQDIFLGKKDSPAYPFWFNGVMDDIRIYNRAITIAEIDAMIGCTNVGNYYRSVTSGNWSNASVWESSSDNVNFYPTDITPDFNSNNVTIQNGEIISITSGADYSINNLTVHPGGTLTITSGTLRVRGKLDVNGGNVNVMAGANLKAQ